MLSPFEVMLVTVACLVDGGHVDVHGSSVKRNHMTIHDPCCYMGKQGSFFCSDTDDDGFTVENESPRRLP